MRRTVARSLPADPSRPGRPARLRRPSARLARAGLLALLALPIACRAPAPADIVIARYNAEPLTLQTAMETFLDSHAGHGVLVQGETAVRQLAGRIIERQVFLDEARSLGLDADEDVLAAAEEYRARTAELLYWKREVDDRVSISDDEVERFYEKTDQALSIALIETAERALAEELRARVEAGEDFSDLAHRHSIHASADLGGMLSFVRRGEIDPAMEAPVFALDAEGDLTPVTATEAGWAFARLEQRTINETRPPRPVAIPQIRSILEERAKDARRAELDAAAREAAGIVLDEALLAPEVVLGADRADEIVARSAGETLTLQAFRETLDLDALAAADAETAAEATRGLADDWARKQAVRAAVKRSGLLDDPEVAAKARVFREDAILKTLYARYVYADIEITEEDVRAYYDAHLEDEFTRPPEVRLAYVAVPTEEEIEAVAERLRAGEDFGAVARELSIDRASAAHGGRVGWVRPGTVLPELEETAFALEPGAVAGPIETTQGWFMITALERRAPEPLPYGVCRSAAQERLTIEREKEAYRTWGTRLRERSVAEVDERGVAQAAEWLEREALRRARENPIEAAPAPPGHDAGVADPSAAMVGAGAEAGHGGPP